MEGGLGLQAGRLAGFVRPAGPAAVLAALLQRAARLFVWVVLLLMQANVDGALAAGIPAIRFESAEQLERELRQRGILA